MYLQGTFMVNYRLLKKLLCSLFHLTHSNIQLDKSMGEQWLRYRIYQQGIFCIRPYLVRLDTDLVDRV